jgi:hypothetical protein
MPSNAKERFRTTWRPRPWIFVVATLSMLVIASYLHEILSCSAAISQPVYKTHAFYVPEGIGKISGIVLYAIAA